MQYQHQPIYKIYSRKRIRLGFLNNTPKGNRFRGKTKKIMPIVIILIISFMTVWIVSNAINPIFERICEDEAKAIATRVTNIETTNVMNQYNYDTFFTIEKDKDGNIQMINANVLKINYVTSDIAVKIQDSLNNSKNNEIDISMGSLTGVKLLSGLGPKVSIKISSVGNVETDLRSEFVAQGVNQTIHRVYLDIKTNVSILTVFSTMQRSITNQFLIAENVILGDIPSNYYNFDGITSQNDALEVMD